MMAPSEDVWFHCKLLSMEKCRNINLRCIIFFIKCVVSYCCRDSINYTETYKYGQSINIISLKHYTTIKMFQYIFGKEINTCNKVSI